MKCPKCSENLNVYSNFALHNVELVDVLIACRKCDFAATRLLKDTDFFEHPEPSHD